MSSRQYRYPHGNSILPSPSPSPVKTKGMVVVEQMVFTVLMMGRVFAFAYDTGVLFPLCWHYQCQHYQTITTITSSDILVVS